MSLHRSQIWHHLLVGKHFRLPHLRPRNSVYQNLNLAVLPSIAINTHFQIGNMPGSGRCLRILSIRSLHVAFHVPTNRGVLGSLRSWQMLELQDRVLCWRRTESCDGRCDASPSDLGTKTPSSANEAKNCSDYCAYDRFVVSVPQLGFLSKHSLIWVVSVLWALLDSQKYSLAHLSIQIWPGRDLKATFGGT